jgi:hypothetical protein
MGIWRVVTGDIECDTCKKVIGKMEYDANDGDFLADRVKITCCDCLKQDATPPTKEEGRHE